MAKAKDDEGYFSHVRELFMNLESALKEEMDKDRVDASAKGERDWTPRPRN